jgi:hypothetical protein
MMKIRAKMSTRVIFSCKNIGARIALATKLMLQRGFEKGQTSRVLKISQAQKYIGLFLFNGQNP